MSDPDRKDQQLHWPVKKTAILIIHGIGEQDPFETLDSFTRPFWAVLSNSFPGQKIVGRHQQLNWKTWVENYVSLLKDGHDTPIDFYEYYWAHKMERQISFPEIYDWLARISDGAQKYYNENLQKSLSQERKDAKVFTNEGTFKKRGYLKRLGWYLHALLFLSRFLPERGYVSKILNALLGTVHRIVIDYIGDIAIYTSTDIKSRHFEIRQAVLNGAVEKLIKLLESGYEQMIIAGHSLGSVIAYDALNRLNQHMNVNHVDQKFAARLTGLVTFGSPLDKIAFFFREHIEKDKYVRRQILENFHSFKAKKSTARYPHTLSNPLSTLLDHVPWVNYWNKNDPVSGHLDFYDIPDTDNVHLDLDAPWGLAHVKYWDFTRMYQDMIERFMK